MAPVSTPLRLRAFLLVGVGLEIILAALVYFSIDALYEWSIIRLHPYHSAQIIKPVEPLKRIVPWVYHHHERWDGKGYPDGAKGDATSTTEEDSIWAK